MSVALNTKHLSSFISEEEYAAIYPQVEAAHKQLEAKNGPGSDFLGWMTLPRDYDKEEFPHQGSCCQDPRGLRCSGRGRYRRQLSGRTRCCGGC